MTTVKIKSQFSEDWFDTEAGTVRRRVNRESVNQLSELGWTIKQTARGSADTLAEFEITPPGNAGIRREPNAKNK